MSTGWIKLHRGIKDHWIWEKDEYFKAFVTIIIECNHTDQKILIDGELLECKRGQKIYSLSTWARVFGKHWSIQRVRTFFALLSRDAIIEVEGLRKTTRLSLVNYETYQGEQQTANTQPTRSQQQLKNDKNEKNE
jgi:DNA replication protein DnaD